LEKAGAIRQECQGFPMILRTFSIVIPAFNEERTLPGLLKSLASQTRPADEIIVVDNNSTDATAHVAATAGCRVMHCAEQGISAARNAGARAATSTHICFLDADSEVTPGWLAAGEKKLACGQFGAVSGWNHFREKNPWLFIYYNSFNFYFTIFLLSWNAARGGMVAANNLIIDREVFFRAGGYENFLGEDFRLGVILSQQKVRTGFAPGMHASYSARRFRQEGFLRTVALWLRSTRSHYPYAKYTRDYSKAQRIDKS
jgi:glycosyltransferase involved in cell wall biosynthesis